MILYLSARPKVALQQLNKSNNAIVVKIEASMLLYPLAEHVKECIMTELSRDNNISEVKVIVLECGGVYFIDYTVVECLLALLRDFSENNKKLVIYKLKANLKDTILRASDAFLIINSNEELVNFVQTACDNDDNYNRLKKSKDGNSQIAHNVYVNGIYIHDEENDINAIQWTTV